MAKLMLKNVRLSFPALFRKAVFNGQETKYEATFLIPKDSALAETVREACDAFIAEKFQGKPPKGLKLTCIADGDTKEYDGYEGMFAVKAASQHRPLVIDNDKTPLTEDDNRIYAGCMVNAQIDFWFSDHALGGKQILATLYGVQFHKHNSPFGGSSVSVDEFDDVSDEDDSDSF